MQKVMREGGRSAKGGLLFQDAEAIIVSFLVDPDGPESACQWIRNWCDVFGCTDFFLQNLASRLGIHGIVPTNNDWRSVLLRWCRGHRMQRESSAGFGYTMSTTHLYKPDAMLNPAKFASISEINDNGEVGTHVEFYEGPSTMETLVCMYSELGGFWTFYDKGKAKDSFQEGIENFITWEWNSQGVLYKFGFVNGKNSHTNAWFPSGMAEDYHYPSGDKSVWRTHTDFKKPPPLPSPPPLNERELWRAMITKTYTPPILPPDPFPSASN